MSLRRRRGVFLLPIGVAFCFMLYYFLTLKPSTPREFLEIKSIIGNDTTPGACFLQVLNPFDPSIMSFVEESQGSVKCAEVQEEFVRLVDGRLEVLIEGAACRYSSVLHSTGIDDFKPKFGSWNTIEGNRSEVLTSDFVDVTCTMTALKITRPVFHSTFAHIVPVNQSVETNRPFEKLSSNRVNVMIIGIDGASRSNFFRQWPKTMKRLDSLGFVTFDHYSKLGDNTFPNLAALLLGKRGYFSEEFPSEINSSWGVTYDNWTEFMWRRFSREGYVTLFSEDLPDIGTYTYKQKSYGFVNRLPTDHYLRTFYLNVYNSHEKKRSQERCFDRTPLYKLQFDYIEEFHRTYNKLGIPAFSFNWNCELAHDYINTMGVADNDMNSLLDRNRDLWNNTVIILMSDHGNRYGKIRETVTGRLESRLPFMSIRIPEVLKKKYPKLEKNLRENSKKLTTHFDTHETLNSILRGNYTHASFSKRGHSLFFPLPENRTCPQLNIPESFCPCYGEADLPVSYGKEAASYLTATINEQILKKQAKSVCQYLRLDEIVSLTARLPPGSVLTNDTTEYATVVFRIVIRMQPLSKAVFEAVLARDYTLDTWTLDGQIERNNKYGNTSACVNDPVLQKYCYCRKQG